MSNSRNAGAAAGGDAIDGLGMFGAFVFLAAGRHVLGVLLDVFQGLLGRACMVYEVFEALGRSG